MTVREMRRRDRALPPEDTIELLRRGEHGVLSTVDSDGQPYGVPLTYCVFGDAIYFHSAVDGHKLDNIAANNRVSFCVVGSTEVLRDEFAIRYTSAIAFGVVEEVFDAEKQRALEGLLSKYSASVTREGLEYIEKMSPRVRVFRIRIERITGKIRR